MESREINMAALNEEEEFEFRLRAEREAEQQPRDSQAELRSTLQEEDWLGRNLAGIGSAAAKIYYGGKQLLSGGTLSPEDQQSVKDWTTIEQEAPVGSIAGNIGMMALPGV